jgi:hypothetical protein
MGGPGSGRHPWRLGVEECRALDIAELCDRGAWQAQPRGEVLWRARRGGEVHARLSYAIHSQQSAADDLLLSYHYSCDGRSPSLSAEHELELECSPGRRCYASCPACGRRLRTLYAPSGAADFACRSCWGLVYRHSRAAETLELVREAAGPTMEKLEALPQRTRHRQRRHRLAAPPAALERELEAEPPLGEQELRLWCLRLRAAGLSYRQIAALLESSKSSVARFCAAGREGIDTLALVRERLQQAWVGPVLPQDGDRRGLEAYLRAMRRHDLHLGLYRHPLSETEERVVMSAESSSQS